MWSEFNDAMQTAEEWYGISGITFMSSLAVFADIIPYIAAFLASILTIYTIISKRIRNKQIKQLHRLKVKLAEKELNE